MPVKWNVFSSRKRTDNREDERENIRSLVNQEINAASTKAQIMRYFDELESKSIRSEAILEEIRTSIDASLSKLDAISDNNSDAKLTEISESLVKIIGLNANLENSFHKDSLLSYKNIKAALDEMEKKNESSMRKLNIKAGWTLTFMIITMLSVICGFVLMYLRII